MRTGWTGGHGRACHQGPRNCLGEKWQNALTFTPTPTYSIFNKPPTFLACFQKLRDFKRIQATEMTAFTSGNFQQTHARRGHNSGKEMPGAPVLLGRLVVCWEDKVQE